MNVVITGASKGIGKAIADVYAYHGHNLILCSRNEIALYKTMEELLTKYPAVTIKAKAFDLSTQAKEFGSWVVASGADIDIVVNNAGLFEPGSVYNEPGESNSNQPVQRISSYQNRITNNDATEIGSCFQYLFYCFATCV
jgi:short-subunit dehydrogenase